MSRATRSSSKKAAEQAAQGAPNQASTVEPSTAEATSEGVTKLNDKDGTSFTVSGVVMTRHEFKAHLRTLNFSQLLALTRRIEPWFVIHHMPCEPRNLIEPMDNQFFCSSELGVTPQFFEALRASQCLIAGSYVLKHLMRDTEWSPANINIYSYCDTKETNHQRATRLAPVLQWLNENCTLKQYKPQQVIDEDDDMDDLTLSHFDQSEEDLLLVDALQPYKVEKLDTYRHKTTGFRFQLSHIAKTASNHNNALLDWREHLHRFMAEQFDFTLCMSTYDGVQAHIENVHSLLQRESIYRINSANGQLDDPQSDEAKHALYALLDRRELYISRDYFCLNVELACNEHALQVTINETEYKRLSNEELYFAEQSDLEEAEGDELLQLKDEQEVDCTESMSDENARGGDAKAK